MLNLVIPRAAKNPLEIAAGCFGSLGMTRSILSVLISDSGLAATIRLTPPAATGRGSC